ncbi:Zinc finger in N-recognin family protein [Histomonas meleagridis]|nr:Zinc finger in N-recognin family protein [Histomonas meleagridis]
MISNYVKSKIEIDESNKPKPKRIDRSAILAKFQKQLNAFADANSNELATFDSASPNSFTCAFCSESFNDNEEPYGIISTIYRTGILSKIEQIIAHDSIPRYPITCRVQTCGHWAHIKCFNSGNENVVYLLALNESIKQCPMDRTTCNTIIPVFENLNTQIEQEIERISSEIISLCGVSIAQTVAYNIALLEVLNRTEPKCIDDKKMILALIHLIRIAFSVKDNNVSDTSDPFALFAIDFF